jgi:hypothetical protein
MRRVIFGWSWGIDTGITRSFAPRAVPDACREQFGGVHRGCSGHLMESIEEVADGWAGVYGIFGGRGGATMS